MPMLRALSQGLSRLAGALLGLLLLAQIVVVAFRYVFAAGRPWASDLLVYVYMIAVLLPGLAVLVANASVRVDVFYSGWQHKRQVRVDRFALLGLLFPAFGYAAWSSIPMARASWQILEASPTYGGLPGFFVLKSLVVLFFALMAATALWLGLRRNPYGKDC